MSDPRAVRFFQLGQLAANIQRIICDIPSTTPDIATQISVFNSQLQSFIDQIRTFYILDADSFCERLHQFYDEINRWRSTVPH